VKLPTTGVKKVLLFASADAGPYHRIGKTTKGNLTFHGKAGRRYRFYSIAIDRDGNREAAPGKPDLKLKPYPGRSAPAARSAWERTSAASAAASRSASDSERPVASISMSSIVS
jgi:hypothetical protein